MSEPETLPPSGGAQDAAPNADPGSAPVLPLVADGAADTTLPAAAEEPAARPAEKPAPKQAVKAAKPRRGPPPAGEVEARTTVILTTSRLSSVAGDALRRGRAVSVPDRRLHRLVHGGKVRLASPEAIARAVASLGPVVDLA